MESNMKKLMADMANRASVAYEGTKDVVSDVSKAVSGKADIAKMNLELMRLRSDCESIFANIGREFYMMKSGTRLAEKNTDTEKTIENWLGAADEKQMQIDSLNARISAANNKGNSGFCVSCGKEYTKESQFCPGCGLKL